MMDTLADAYSITPVDNGTNREVAVFVIILEKDLKCPSGNDVSSGNRARAISDRIPKETLDH